MLAMVGHPIRRSGSFRSRATIKRTLLHSPMLRQTVLKQEENQFFETMRLDLELEDGIKEITYKIKYQNDEKEEIYIPETVKPDKPMGDSGVIVETAKGLEYATVVFGLKEVSDDQIVHPLKPILRKATEKDEKAVKENEKKIPEPAIELEDDMPKAKLINVDIEKEMKKSFLEYSMSVIVSRALPDVRDGMKPGQRRILYAMYEDNLTHDKPFRKSATTVGNVLGRYHPHGDSAVYQSMVRMAQDFSLRYPLIEGHGNFGNVDGDGAAAYRYTEARMARISGHMMNDIEKSEIKAVLISEMIFEKVRM